MEEIYEAFKGTLVVHDKYQGVVCGYNETHFILAVETDNKDRFFRALKKYFFVDEAYKDQKYRYIFENESEIIKQQQLWQQKNNQTQQEEKAS